MHTSTGKFTELISEKIIVSGVEVEQYKYKDKPVRRNYKRRKRKTRIEDSEKTEKKNPQEKTDFSVRRTRKEIRRLVNSNTHLIKFLTLTTKITDIGESNKLFNLFTQRMKDRFPEFQYLAVPEFQKDIDFFGKLKPEGGAVHYHLLCNLRYVKQDKIADVWNQGFIKIKRVNHVSNLGRYLCKYLQKDMFDKRMFRKKKFFCSQDLKRPEEIINDQAKSFMQTNADNLILGWEATFKDDYRGEIEYKIFNFKNRNS